MIIEGGVKLEQAHWGVECTGKLMDCWGRVGKVLCG